ncbi:TetR/AcrR family transcriptional regulator [Mesorhizobium sp. YC-39]|uniref:TetR/AcrR family transcriptional regulator n=1 Tax=unclassified Mesorhizobium TaxID=325217 RepID=UPI0021E704CB|nr:MULTISPECIES: TetR/AcrR family transcriptional regulator [unclassified Mesorhizobium]MCV3210667.1 TetR/AcrR family transcriptional regulator [Mesorhizobium sp. YC-2]MCV3232435.1 TetR/AcrR family transcriptional regulator [Mesorhizobium sp. YC-39]
MAGRPREFDRDQALEKARDAFWTRGYEGVSMADLVSALGIASARIYAAFGSKEELFREAVSLYEANEGGFATRALAEEATVRRVIERMLREAVETYTRPGQPQGCMVVSAATNCAAENDGVLNWLAEHRLARTASIIERLQQGVRDGELKPDTDAETLGDYYATLMHGLSVQARDGVPKQRLGELITVAMQALDARLSQKL